MVLHTTFIHQEEYEQSLILRNSYNILIIIKVV